MSALETTALNKHFGGLHVTQNIALTIKPGERIGLIGPNGAGKTTLINLLAGAIAPSSGAIRLHGQDVTRLGQADRVRAGLCRTFQITQLAMDMTVLNQVELAVHARLGTISRMTSAMASFAHVREEAQAHLQQLGIGHLEARSPSEIAYGEQRLVEIAIAMSLQPKVLLLDEPMAGVPSTYRSRLLETLGRLPGDLAVLMIEHDMDLVFSFSKRIVVLAHGAIIADGAPADIRQNPAVREAYLG